MAKVWKKLSLITADGGQREELVFVEASEEAVRKLTAKEWVKKTVEDSPEEFNPSVIGIMEAGEKIAEKSKTASDCAKPFTAKYGTNLLRGLNRWPKARRNSSKQRPK